MPTFNYSAVTQAGKKRQGMLDAENLAAAGDALRKRGLVPLAVRPAGGRKGQRRGSFSLRLPGRGVSRAQVAATVRQLATLLSAGLAVDVALGSLVSHRRGGRMVQVLTEVRDSIREGRDLASAFEEHPRVFNDTFVAMIKAGEASGTLDIVLERLADHLEQQLALSHKINSAMAYPVFMLIVGVCVVSFLLAFIVPKITQIFLDMDRMLPLPTRMLLAMSDMLRNFWPLLLLVAAGLGLGLWRYARTEKGRRRLHSRMLRTPIIGPVARNLCVGRFSRTLGMLLKNEVSLVPSLDIVRTVVGNAVLEDEVAAMHEGVQEGHTLSEHMERAWAFPETAVQMVAAGEASGQLDKMLLVIADDCEKRVESRLQILTSLLEPVMILFLAVFVGFIVMAVILPIFEMSNLMG